MDLASHRDALLELTGPSSVLWTAKTEMALVLLCTVPSGDAEIVKVRDDISARLRLPSGNSSRALRPSVVHSDRAVGQDAARLVYVGDGRNDPQCRPSVFYNPFFPPRE